MILLIGGEKGGTGKTTIATNLAAMRAKVKKDTILIDTDKQSTASYWCFKREESGMYPRITSVQKFGKTVRTEVLALKEKYDDVIIDAGGRDSEELRGAMLVADIALIPLRPSQFDLWTLSRINDLVAEVKDINEKLRAFVCLNQLSANPVVKEANEAKEFFTDFQNISLAQSTICERISFRKAAILGASVLELEQKDNKAIDEMNQLYKEMFNGY
jgi:chromosome partitioning protein